MQRTYDVITFDCYGTLVDWEGGIVDAFARAARDAGHDPTTVATRDAVLAAHAAIEPRIQAAGFRAYREVLREVAERTTTELGWPVGAETAAFLPDSLPGWTPFPDTNPALERLSAAGHRLGILSNVDDDLLAGTRERLAVRFDPIVTAQQVRSYKPAHAHFEEARRRIGDDARWLHAAESWFHDVVPATELGIDVVWINRNDRPPTTGATPLRVLPDLTALADWLA